MNIPELYKKPLKYFLIVCSLVAAYGLIGFFLIPALLKWKLPEIIQQETGRKTQVAKIQFNPFLLSASIKGFEIQEHKGQPFAKFENFDIDINAFQSIKQLSLVFDEVWLNKLYVRIAKQKNGEFNFSDLIKNKKEEKKEEKGKVFPLVISKLSLTEGKLVFEDAHFAKPVQEDVIPINLEINNFSTQVDKKSRLGFSMALRSGGKLDWNGELGINPIHSSGKIKLDKLKLERIYELALQDKIPFRINGTELFEADYDVRYSKKGLDLVVSRSKLAIKDFKFAGNEQNKMAVHIPSFALEGAYKVSQKENNLQINADKTKVEIHDIQLDGLNPDKAAFKIPSVVLAANYQASIVNNAMSVTANQGQFDVKGFQLTEKEQNKELVKIPAIALQGIEFNLKDQKLVVNSISINDAMVKAWLSPEGLINYQTLFTNPSTQPINPAQPEAKPNVPPKDEATKAPWLCQCQ